MPPGTNINMIARIILWFTAGSAKAFPTHQSSSIPVGFANPPAHFHCPYGDRYVRICSIVLAAAGGGAGTRCRQVVWMSTRAGLTGHATPNRKDGGGAGVWDTGPAICREVAPEGRVTRTPRAARGLHQEQRRPDGIDEHPFRCAFLSFALNEPPFSPPVYWPSGRIGCDGRFEMVPFPTGGYICCLASVAGALGIKLFWGYFSEISTCTRLVFQSLRTTKLI